MSNLLNEVGKTLGPKVRCVINLANRGAGLPDGGLFTPDQFQRASEVDPLPGQLPSRGAIEFKGTADDFRTIAASKQVIRYLQKYRQVLVTNYRDFALIGRDADGQPARLEECRLAPSEKKHPPNDRTARFNRHEAAWSLHVPMIRALFEQERG